MIASPALLIAACKSSDEPEEVTPAPGAVTAPAVTAPPPATTGTVPAATPTRPRLGDHDGRPDPCRLGDPEAGRGRADGRGRAEGRRHRHHGRRGGASTKLAACAAKCQSILQTCLTPKFPADGGLPALADPAACQGSFDSCRTACAP